MRLIHGIGKVENRNLTYRFVDGVKERLPLYLHWEHSMRKISEMRGVKVDPELLNFESWFRYFSKQGFNENIHTIIDISAYTRQFDFRSKELRLDDFIIVLRETCRSFVVVRKKRDSLPWVNVISDNVNRARVAVWDRKRYEACGKAHVLHITGKNELELHHWAIAMKAESFKRIAAEVDGNKDIQMGITRAILPLMYLRDKNKTFKIFN